MSMQVLNLFLALLLSSFGAESLQHSQDDSGEPNKLQEAVDRINRFVLFIKSHILYCVKVKMAKKGNMIDGLDHSITKTDISSKDMVADGRLPMRNGRVCEHDASEGEEEGPQEAKGRHGLALRKPSTSVSCSLVSVIESSVGSLKLNHPPAE